MKIDFMEIRRFVVFVLMVGVSLFVSACETNDDEDGIENDIEVELPIGSGNNDVLVWSDEFSNTGSPSSNNWVHEIGAGGWGNNELQYYTNRLGNSEVENGILTITAKKETFFNSAYTSARLVTLNKFSFTYGKVEVRAKLPAGGGTWPAIWMLGDNITTVGWPACGEIDIMEHTGNDLGITSSAIHNTSGHGNTPYVKHRDLDEDVTTEFHIYAINWTKDKIDFLVDDVIHYTYQPTVKTAANWPFDKDQFIILNIAMGGTLGGVIDANFTTSTMEIDYVRVYQ